MSTLPAVPGRCIVVPFGTIIAPVPLNCAVIPLAGVTLLPPILTTSIPGTV